MQELHVGVQGDSAKERTLSRRFAVQEIYQATTTPLEGRSYNSFYGLCKGWLLYHF